MSTLFTINQSWISKPALYEQLAYASSGDAIVLLEDAVLSLQSSLSLASFLAKCQAKNIAVYAVKEDVEMRGLGNKYETIELIQYTDLVELVEQFDKQVAW